MMAFRLQVPNSADRFWDDLVGEDYVFLTTALERAKNISTGRIVRVVSISNGHVYDTFTDGKSAKELEKILGDDPPTNSKAEQFKERVFKTLDAYIFTERERARARRDVERSWDHCFNTP